MIYEGSLLLVQNLALPKELLLHALFNKALPRLLRWKRAVWDLRGFHPLHEFIAFYIRDTLQAPIAGFPELKPPAPKEEGPSHGA